MRESRFGPWCLGKVYVSLGIDRAVDGLCRKLYEPEITNVGDFSSLVTDHRNAARRQRKGKLV